MAQDFNEIAVSEIIKTINVCHIKKYNKNATHIMYDVISKSQMVLINIVHDTIENDITAIVNNKPILYLPVDHPSAAEIINLMEYKISEQNKFNAIKQQIVSEQENYATLDFLRNNRL